MAQGDYIRFEDKLQPEEIRKSELENEVRLIRDIYTYYYAKGIKHAVLQKITNLLTFIFLILFTFFIFCVIDYNVLREVTDDDEIQLSDAIRIKVPWYFGMFFTVAGMFVVWEMVKTILSVFQLWKIHGVYKKMDVNDNSLIINRYTFKQIYERWCLLPDGCDLTFDDALKVILQHKNFQLGVAKNVIPEIKKSVLNSVDSFILKVILKECMYTTKVTQWYLKYGLWYYIFLDNNTLRPEICSENTNEFNESIRQLRIRFRIISIIGILITPFVISYLLLYFAFKVGSIAYTSPGRLLRSRTFSITAKETSRIYNELDHEFESRLPIASRECDTYLQKVNRPWWTPIAKFISYVSATLLITTFFINILNDSILMNVYIGTQNILGICAILGILFATSSTSIQKEDIECEDVVESFDSVCEALRISSDLDPYTIEAKRRVINWYPLKLEIMARECFSIISTPFVIFFIYVKYSDNILRYIRKHAQKTTIGEVFSPVIQLVV